MLVLLEQVAGVHLVAVLHQTLREETRTRSGRTRGNTHTHGVRQSCSTSSLTSRAEHCRGTDIILCGFQVTELALKATQNAHDGFKSFYLGHLARFLSFFNKPCLSTPSSFHLCFLDMRRLPPQAPCPDTHDRQLLIKVRFLSQEIRRFPAQTFGFATLVTRRGLFEGHLGNRQNMC